VVAGAGIIVVGVFPVVVGAVVVVVVVPDIGPVAVSAVVWPVALPFIVVSVVPGLVVEEDASAIVVGALSLSAVCVGSLEQAVMLSRHMPAIVVKIICLRIS
jgi:hypothetical protein